MSSNSQDQDDDAVVVQVALYNYETFYGMIAGTASLREVEESTAGLNGWASFGAFPSPLPSSDENSNKNKCHLAPGDAVEARYLQYAILESIGASPPPMKAYCHVYGDDVDDDDDDESRSYIYEDDDEDNVSLSCGSAQKKNTHEEECKSPSPSLSRKLPPLTPELRDRIEKNRRGALAKRATLPQKKNAPKTPPSVSKSSSLTPEQKNRIEQNRKEALCRLERNNKRAMDWQAKEEPVLKKMKPTSSVAVLGVRPNMISPPFHQTATALPLSQESY